YVLADTTGTATGVYSNTQVKPGTYHIWTAVSGSTTEYSKKTVKVETTNPVAVPVYYFTLTLKAGAGGTVDPAEATVRHLLEGTTGVSIKATPAAGANPMNQFTGWTAAPAVGTIAGVNAADTTYTMPTNAADKTTAGVTITAAFKSLQTDGTAQVWTYATGASSPSLTAAVPKYWNPGSANTGTAKASIMTYATAGITAPTDADYTVKDDAAAFELTANGFGTGVVLTLGGSASANQKTVTVNAVAGKTSAADKPTAYVAVLRVTDDAGLTVDIPLRLNVTLPTTFDVTIATKKDGATAASDVGTVELIRTTGTDAPEVCTGTWGAGEYTFQTANQKPDWNNTYTVYVNGVSTGKTVTNANHTAIVDVKNLHTVKYSANTYTGETTDGADFSYTAKSGYTGQVAFTKTSTITRDVGVVLPGGTTINLQGNSNLDAAGTTHYRFKNWNTRAGTALPVETVKDETTTYTLPAIVADATAGGVIISPVYQQQHKVTVSSNNTAMGTITTAATLYVDDGSRGTLTGAPATAHRIKGWTLDGGGTNGADNIFYDALTDGAAFVDAQLDTQSDGTTLTGLYYYGTRGASETI
ncbi:MAG: hypothetical protein RSB55_08660, partial [Oscillospiraceae bacterium]